MFLWQLTRFATSSVDDEGRKTFQNSDCRNAACCMCLAERKLEIIDCDTQEIFYMYQIDEIKARGRVSLRKKIINIAVRGDQTQVRFIIRETGSGRTNLDDFVSICLSLGIKVCEVSNTELITTFSQESFSQSIQEEATADQISPSSNSVIDPEDTPDSFVDDSPPWCTSSLNSYLSSRRSQEDGTDAEYQTKPRLKQSDSIKLLLRSISSPDKSELSQESYGEIESVAGHLDKLTKCLGDVYSGANIATDAGASFRCSGRMFLDAELIDRIREILEDPEFPQYVELVREVMESQIPIEE